MNMCLLETREDLLVIDAGLMFPEEEMLGIDLVIPDFTYILQNREKVRAIVLTHGHEDHTGALPFLLRELPVPVYGTLLSLGLVEEKLKEFGLQGQIDLRRIRPREAIELSSLRLDFIRVAHSIPDGVAIAIHTPLGLVLHAGDFKFDQTPVDGELTDYHKLAELGDQGVLVLLSDSTNALREGFTPSEREVGSTFKDIFRVAQRRIIVACFASNIHRIQQVLDVAEKLGKKVAINGKSMVANVRIAAELGYLRVPEGVLVRLDELRGLPPERGVIVTTGSQGEPLSAIARIAVGEHKQIQIQKGDMVIFSARVIPGNEKSIARAINQLIKRGAEVITEEVARIHVSGHPSQEELKLMLNLVRPRFFVPIHGEYRHLHFHARMAQRVMIPKENIILAENGDVLEFTPNSGKIVGHVSAGRVFVDGKGVGDVGDTVLRDRQHLAQDGMVIVVLGIDKQRGEVIAGPEIISRGFVYVESSAALFEEARKLVLEVLQGLSVEEKADWSLIKQRIRAILRKFLYKTMERRPMILPVIIEI
ncbi:MAG: ribonuclease J [candidate division NC10 bacterium]|nr:ribonuclease J [candidate division NC10 bacterium]